MNEITLFVEEDLSIDINSIVTSLNTICTYTKFKNGKSILRFNETIITSPESYKNLDKTIIEETKADIWGMLFTEKPYDNNYFFSSFSNLVIISLYGWNSLTNLPMNNGVVYFIADLLALKIDDSYRHNDITGCIYDFGWDKTAVDSGMRLGHVCPKCLSRIINDSLSKSKEKIFADLRKILDNLSSASKWQQDIIDYFDNLKSKKKNKVKIKKKSKIAQLAREPKEDSSEFDVFLAHNSGEKAIVKRISEKLKKRGLKPWLDKEQIPPGRWFQDIIQQIIPKVKSAAIIIGKKGLGRWEIVELRAFISQCVDRHMPVIPVLLPGIAELPDELLFLREFAWVRFHKNIDDVEALKDLEWGITGKKPD